MRNIYEQKKERIFVFLFLVSPWYFFLKRKTKKKETRTKEAKTRFGRKYLGDSLQCPLVRTVIK